MVRVLVTGASGMLGATLVEKWAPRLVVYATGGSEFPRDASYRRFDLRNASYEELIQWAKPEIIVHCAALTNVDACEQDPDLASLVNGRSVAKLLDAAPGARIIFISTEAVLGGAHRAAIDAPISPQNAYARSKALGESILREAGPPHVVIRTTLVGKNRNPAKQSFAEWIVRSAAARRSITLFSDALFTPIAAPAFADEIEWLIGRAAPPVVHISGREETSKLDFGVRLVTALGLDSTIIASGSIADAKFAAKRAPDQTLDCSAWESFSGRLLPDVGQTIEILRQEMSS